MAEDRTQHVEYRPVAGRDSIEKSNDSDDDVPVIDFNTDEEYVPNEDEEFIDPRLKDYPNPLVAKTVDLQNDPTEPTLTFRFWTLTTFWVITGCSVSSIYYFKAFAPAQTGFLVQLLSAPMGSFMAKYLPNRNVNIMGLKFNLNPGPWNAKEHALILIAFWGSSYTAYGLGPLSAMELYYGKKMGTSWAILFLITTQLMGYGFAGLYRDILVRPPQMYYPGVLPMVSMFNAMHNRASMASNSMRFFGLVAGFAFLYAWFPSFFWPMLSSLPILCYLGAGDWRAFLMGSGTYGFGFFDISLDWNYINFFSPLYTPLWANLNRFAGALLVCWLAYPLMYFADVMGSQTFPPMSAGTWDQKGTKYNITAVLNADFSLNQTALENYSHPRWSASYAMHFMWGFAASSAVIVYSILFHGKTIWKALGNNRAEEHARVEDPYVKLMEHSPRVPHSWYMVVLASCLLIAVVQLYGGEMQLPWWGLLLAVSISAAFTLFSGILLSIANMQISADYLSELIAGVVFPGKPMAVLTYMVYGRQILVQCLNMVSDVKFGFYMKIPERDVFFAQIYGTLLGPFINYTWMRVILDLHGPEIVEGTTSGPWAGLQTKNFYSLSVLWGVLGPQSLFSHDSPYRWIMLGFIIGPALVVLHWALTKRFATRWNILQSINPVIILNGASLFPIYPTTNLMTSILVAITSMGYVYRYCPAWFRKYNYLLGAGLDCGTQLVQVALLLVVDLGGTKMPLWWGNSGVAVDRCFAPEGLPPSALN